MPLRASATVLALLSTVPAAGVPSTAPERSGELMSALRHPPALARQARFSQAGSGTRDSLKNGALIGALVGGALAGAAGCAAGKALNESGEESDCAGGIAVVAVLGVGIGAAIGAGVDALFEQAPSPAGAPTVRRRGLRLRFRF
jgi:hypothetical protein